MDSNSISIPNAMAPSNNSRNSGLAATADESAGEPSIPGSNRRLAGSPRSPLTPRSQFADPARVKVVSPPPVASASASSSSASSSSAADGAISRAASGLAARAWSDDLQDTSTEDEDEDRRLEAAAFGSPISDAGSITDAPLLTQSSSMTSMAKKGAMKKVEPSAMATAKTLAADKENAQAKANATKDKTQWKSNVEKWHDADGDNVLTPRGSKRKQKLKQEPLLRAVLQPTAASTASTNAKNVTTPSAVRGAQPLSQSQQDDEAAFDDALTFALQMDQFQTPAEAAALPPLGPSHVLKPSTSLKSSAMRMMERSPLLRPLSSIQDDPEWGFRNASEVRPDLKDEFMSLCVLSYPVIFTYVLEFLPGIVSMTLVGHMDSPKTKEYVDGVSLSTMFMNLTGIALGFGLATAMDTLCSQAYGAGKPMKMGIYFQCGILVLGIAVIPVFLINWYTEQFLLWMGQPEEVAALAGRFSRLVLPGIPFLYVYELFKKLLQAQNVVKPMVYIAILSNVVNVLLGIYLTWYTTLGYDGAAIARTVANVVLPGALVPFFLWNPDVAKQWWPGWKFSQAIRYMRTFLTLGIPGMFMMMLEWWAFEIMAAFVGLLPNSVVAISVHSVLANVSTMAFNVFLGIGVATNIRVGNYVGSNQPEHAKMASVLGMVLSIAVSTLLALAILFTRNLLPMIFINDATSVALAAHACLYLIPYQMIDSINSVMQGVFRGTGYQTIGAYINLFGYFAVGLPLGVYLAFQWDYGVEGLWLGLTSGIGVGAVMSLYKVYHMDWNEMADTARLRAS